VSRPNCTINLSLVLQRLIACQGFGTSSGSADKAHHLYTGVAVVPTRRCSLLVSRRS
jgi:hypothetical protein